MTAATLIVLRTGDLGRARLFYEAIGLRFVDERHGSGPHHLAATLDSGVGPNVVSDPAGRLVELTEGVA